MLPALVTYQLGKDAGAVGSIMHPSLWLELNWVWLNLISGRTASTACPLVLFESSLGCLLNACWVVGHWPYALVVGDQSGIWLIL
jgi:hypothetical protein